MSTPKSYKLETIADIMAVNFLNLNLVQVINFGNNVAISVILFNDENMNGVFKKWKANKILLT